MTTETLTRIDPEHIYPNPWQTRKTMSPEGLESLAASIGRDGLLQPIVVRMIRRGRYELVAGQRRLQAWKILLERGSKSAEGGIPAIVRDVDDKQMLFDTLTENLAREDVDPIEETRAIARAVEVMEDLTQADLAERLRTSPQQLSNRIRLLRLPDQTLELVSNGRMSWTAARDLICLVGEDHTHETELDDLIKRVGQWRHNLPARELRRYLGPTCASKPTRWRPLTDLSGVVQYAGMAVSQPPLFDVEAFKAAHPKQVHNLPDPTGTGYHAWTCAGSEWNAAQREAKKLIKETESGPAREAWADIMVEDPVVKAIGLDREKFSTENMLTEEEVEALGSRGQFLTSRGPDRVIRGTSKYDEPPPFFDKSECVSSCIRGAVYAADFPGGKQQLKCGNADCYNGKLSEGLQRFRDKERKRAEHVEATRLAIKEGLFPILRGQDELCRYMLKVLIEDGAVTGSPTRPLGYDNLARAVNYHSSGAIRLARELGVPEDKIAGIGGNENLWWTRDAMQMVDELDLTGVATVEALAIALQEAGMTAKDFEPHS